VADELSVDGRIVRWGKRALILVAVGLMLQLGAIFYWTPVTFILSAAIGLPCVVVGAGVFGWSVLRARVTER
jgi:hypothetical protein